MSMNPLLHFQFEIPFHEIRAEHIEPAITTLVERARATIESIAADPSPRTYDNTLLALDQSTEPLEWAMGIVSHLEAVSTHEALRKAYNAVQPIVAEFYASIPLHAGLWRALQAYAKSSEAAELDPTRTRYLRKLVDDFRRNGADLTPERKQRLADIDVELANVTTRFAQHALDSTNAWELVITDESRLAGLPESARAAAEQSAKDRGLSGWRFSLAAPSVLPLLTHADDGSLREEVYRAYSTRATLGDQDNRPLIVEILRLRAERAHLLGFANFADLVLEDRMASRGQHARTFVADLRARCEAAFERENQALLEFRRSLEGPAAPPLASWDVAYYVEKQRKAIYDFDDEALRPYFALERVLEGLFEIAGRLYGVRIEPNTELPTWHDSVRTYDLLDDDGSVLGSFYVDMFPRDVKRDGAWMHGLVSGIDLGDRVEPHLGLICGNLTPPVGDRPALLRHREVETLFHEFGHLMHHCLSRCPVRALSGARVAWDFVELPSQIMENWCWHREAVDLFARHIETGDAIPDRLFDALRRARSYRAANAMMRQLGFADVDLALHIDYQSDRDGDPLTYALRIMQPYAPAPFFDGYAMIASFTHLFARPVGYASGYYSYKWAEVLDADAFTRFEQEGILSRRVGLEFRREVLARGDSRDPMELYRAFMGRAPDVEPLLRRFAIHEPA